MKLNINKNSLILFFFSITLLLVLTSNDVSAATSRRLPTAYTVHTYGTGKTFTSLQTWEDLTDVNLASVTTTDQSSSGNTLYVASTTLFDSCVLNESTVSVGGQTLTITGVTSGVSLAVSNITGTIASGTAVQTGFVLTAYQDGAPYNDSVTITGATNTSATLFRVIRAASGQRGTPTSGVRFEIASTATYGRIIYLAENYAGAYDIFGKLNQSGGTSHAVFWGNSSFVKFVGCYAQQGSFSGSSNGMAGFSMQTVTNGIFINNISDGFISTLSYSGGFLSRNSGEGYFYNNTVINCYYAFNKNQSTGTSYAKNNIISNYTNIFSGSAWSQVTNATSGVTFDADVYHLASNDTGAKNLGTDLTADANFPFNDDIDGYTRSGTWDIGVDELVGASQTCTWNGSVSTDWANKNNWTNCDGSSPESVDDVVINTASANQPILDLAGGKTINSLSIGSSAVSTLTLSNGLVDINVNKLTITNNLTIGGSGTITSTANTTAQTHSVNMAVGGNVDIASGGKIDVTGKGLSGGVINTIGNGTGGGGKTTCTTQGSGGGGGYGGVGGSGLAGCGASGGSEYKQDSTSQPTDLGSGGGGSNSATGGAGGGSAKLVISGTLSLTGSILADGGNGSNGTGGGGGAGSGGSIWIQSGSITNSGTIRAKGGNGGTGSYNAGGGGAGGRISLNFTKASGYNLTNTATGGTGYQAGGNGSIYYNVSGIQTSSVIDLTNPRDFTTLTYNKTTTANSISTPSLTVDARAGDALDTNDSSWTAWQTNLASGASLNAFDNKRYVQYRLNLASNNAIQSPKPYDKPTANPSLQDISFNYMTYLDKTITSSVYNSNSDANLIAGISWDESLENNTNIKFQIQTSADGATNWSGWLGPDGTNSTYFDELDSPTYCTKNGSIVTCTVDAIPTIFKNGTDDHYYQYKAFLTTTDGLATPTLNSVTVTYVVNANPEIEANQTTAVPDSNKKVNISYNVRDTDSISGTITPSFEYSLDGGSNWTAITSGCLEATDLDAKTISAPATPPEN
ncbi:MAG TPA: hypothetical protein DCS08_01255, partial [Candidatus Moranbacteria bacterium]|nr:hypothetical protein [Candidatus Moranbacteria bacterium]